MASIAGSTPEAPPIIDISPYFSDDATARRLVVQQVNEACLKNGFFQITNHGIPHDVQKAVIEQAKEFFDLPIEQKAIYNRDVNPFGRGYEQLRSQNFEKKTAGDLKEGFYLGRQAEPKHFSQALQKYSTGPNLYPQTVSQPAKFQNAMECYHDALTGLANVILQILAETLGLPKYWFREFSKEPIATLRLLHYPPQEPDASPDERGIGAHTDFGGITILLQDDVGGLEVYDKENHSWVGVAPVSDAFVVNLGNLMMRWTNDKFISNVHRVINKGGRERYSVPFFFSGNPDFVVRCIPGCEDPISGPKYAPIRVQDWIDARFADTYGGRRSKDGAGDPVQVHGDKHAV